MTFSVNQIRQSWLDYFQNQPELNHKYFKSSSLIPDNPTLLLNSAGMVPFIPYFTGVKDKPNPPRAVSIQKCARVGGKDSDLKNIGFTPRHHSFFEMLGNFSFGDYFKSEAITLAWKFLTEVLKLDQSKLYFSVFEGDDQRPFDEQAYTLWSEIIKEYYPADTKLEERIWKMGASDNYWGPPGPTGPCGPCSEIYYDLGEKYTNFDDRYIEIWNLVFMEFEKLEDGSLIALKDKNIDTGAGLERLAMVMQQVDNTFKTDELSSIITSIETNIQKFNPDNYASAAISSQQQSYIKIVADHLRCVCFLIADGVRPSNLGRGYVLRMLIRRAARFVYLLSENKAYNLSTEADLVIDIYGKFYEELARNKTNIKEVLLKEEEQFAKTIERGLEILKELIQKSSDKLDGAKVFDLYSTYGFPLELTEDILAEAGRSLDYKAYEAAKLKHSSASSSGNFEVSITADKDFKQLLNEYPETKFLGYEVLKTQAKIVAIFNEKHESLEQISSHSLKPDKPSTFQVLLDQTPFYAESGGQVGDHGYFKLKDSHSTEDFSSSLLINVVDTKAINQRILHKINLTASKVSNEDYQILAVGDQVSAELIENKRKLTEIHHTSCHLLQAALRRVLGDSVQQAGSQVNAEATRFDFNYDKALSKDQLKQVEILINDWIKANYQVKTASMPYEQAISSGALAFFGDKYDDEVRVLSIGDEINTDDNKVSVELCGGTHVKSLGEIQKAVIASESSVASGIRRIKLHAASEADKFLAEQADKEAAEKLKAEAAAKQKADKKAKIKAIQSLVKEKYQEVKTNAEASADTQVLVLDLNQVFNDGIDSENMKKLSSDLKADFEKEGKSAFVMFASNFENKVMLMSAASAALPEKFSAAKAVKLAAGICGGGGGGKPEFAQAGAKDASKVPEALAAVKQAIMS
jgi:alanyl-tRNA synthetase